MFTKSGDAWYNHPNVMLNDEGTYIDYGWYKHFQCVIPTDLLKIQKIMVPRCSSVVGCPQKKFLTNLIDEVHLKCESKHLFSNGPDYSLDYQDPIDFTVLIDSIIFWTCKLVIFVFLHSYSLPSWWLWANVLANVVYSFPLSLCFILLVKNLFLFHLRRKISFKNIFLTTLKVF